jgi:hypothetical protein
MRMMLFRTVAFVRPSGMKAGGMLETRPLEIVHIDLFGPTKTKGLKGEKYFMLLVDDYIRMTVVCFLKNKSEAFENFKIYKEMVENEMDSKIKCLRSDNG